MWFSLISSQFQIGYDFFIKQLNFNLFLYIPNYNKKSWVGATYIAAASKLAYAFS